MNTDGIKLFETKETEVETLIQTIRIYIQDIGPVFGIEKYFMLIKKNAKEDSTEGIEQSNL